MEYSILRIKSSNWFISCEEIDHMNSMQVPRENGMTNIRLKNVMDCDSKSHIFWKHPHNNLSNKKMQRQVGVIKVPL